MENRKNEKENLKSHFEFLFTKMVRRNYKPYKSNYRSYAGKKKWAPLMNDIVPTDYSISPQQIGGTFVTLVSNSLETAVPTPTILKAKHLKVALDFKFDATVLSAGFCALLYVPQGYAITSGICNSHPEWILAWRNIPNVVSATHHDIMLSSSMCRNLNSGDKIIVYFSFYNAAPGPTTMNISGKFSGVVRNN